MAEAEKKVRLKLLVDRKMKNGVMLFVEAGKDFVDFLFHILSLPVGTVTRLQKMLGMVGSLGNLYDSIENLSDNYYIQPSSGNSDIKDSLLKPKMPTYFGSTKLSNVPLLLPTELTSSDDSQKTYFRCRGNDSDCRGYVGVGPSATCPYYKNIMIYTVALVEARHHKPAAADNRAGDDSRGYVKGVVTYMVMDDPLVKPMSTLSSITLLHKLNVADLNSLEEKVIEFAMNEGVALMKASLQSKTVLTDVFFSRKERAHQ